MPIYETGHARNVQCFEELFTFVASWGITYDPTNSAISLANLTAKLTSAQTQLTAVTGALAENKNQINLRDAAYADLNKLVTRTVNYYESTGADKKKIEDVRSLKRKLDGVRSTPVKDDPNTPEDESLNAVSASQQSFTQKAEHFAGIIALYEADVLYNPAEAALEVAALQAKRTAMLDANTAVMTSYTGLSNARGTRNTAMYAEGTGLVDLAQMVKKYTLAAFGNDSTQYNQIKGLEFTRPR